MAYSGSSFDFSTLASPALPEPILSTSASTISSLPSLSFSSFNPDRVQRITFRWTRAMTLEREEEILHPSPLGPVFHPQGRYVFASDYANLLQMYHELEELLKELRKRK